jgi:DNA-binding HxlR family transcriptional regulator
MKRPLPARPSRPVRGSATGRPVMALLDLLGRRWTLRVLWELRDGPVKFRELAQRADAMSQSVLSRRLNELETACFVTSDEDGWRLTDNGAELLRVFSPLSRFATRWAELIIATQAAEEASAGARADHRQAKKPRGGHAGDHAGRRAPPARKASTTGPRIRINQPGDESVS